MKTTQATGKIFPWPPPKLLEFTRGTQRIYRDQPKVCAEVQRRLPPQAYVMEITTRYTAIVAGGPAGLRYAQSVFAQLREKFGRQLPCLRIEDAPDFPVRGFMLDISRGKVPTMETLERLIGHLAALRYNHLQLYTEHTFAFRRHEKIWRESSPLSAAEITALQKICQKHGIELAANFNSFGHFERWLKHPEYNHLAECPDGFVHPLKGKMTHGTTLKPNAASLKFLDKLWAEYLPLFKSERFNLGGDEPWELGLGWSKTLVQKYGKHRVYLDFLKKLHRQAAKHGKEILFWGDILLESPEWVKEVPADATALLWGYEANHPFAEQGTKLAAAKRKFWVCPGTSAWNTFTGRTDNMLANLESAAKHGLANGAEGFLLTSWGDGGNHQPWPVMYPGLVYAAGLAWNQKGAHRENLERTTDGLFFPVAKPSFTKILLESGRLENGLNHYLHNSSHLHRWFFSSKKSLKKEVRNFSAKKLESLERKLKRLIAQIAGARPRMQEMELACSELALGLDMAKWAARRARLVHAGKSAKPLIKVLQSLIERFEEIWAKRARVGGLHEATARMRAVEKEL